jgi:hypothetical protein
MTLLGRPVGRPVGLRDMVYSLKGDSGMVWGWFFGNIMAELILSVPVQPITFRDIFLMSFAFYKKGI